MADHRRHPELLAALRRIAPGYRPAPRHGRHHQGHLGALIVIGEPQELQFLFSGGLQLDHPFTPQFLYELAKMDGAIILNSDSSRIVCANVQLMPDPTIASSETGTRHRTAERVAKQTGALVISISQARDTVSVYVGEIRYQLEAIADVLAKTNQAMATLETYRGRLEQVSARLTALEFQSAVTLDDVLVVVQRAEMATRMGEEIERNVIELGREGWLIDMQLSELMREIPRDRVGVVRDYEMAETTAAAPRRCAASPGCRTTACWASRCWPSCWGTAPSTRSTCIAPARLPRAGARSRGSRSARSPPWWGVRRARESILRASLRELESCEGDRRLPRPARSARDCAACRSTTSWIATCSCKARS